MPHYLSTDEVAAMLHCSRQGVNYMARSGRLPVAGTVGRQSARLYSPEAIAAFLLERNGA